MYNDRTLQSPKQILDQAIKDSWSAETSASPDEWNATNPALGQCAVTACVRQDYLGGDIYNCVVTHPDGTTESHYYNVLDDMEDDLTKQQFPEGATYSGGGPKTKGHESTYDYVLSHDQTRMRYEILREKVRRRIMSLSFHI